MRKKGCPPRTWSEDWNNWEPEHMRNLEVTRRPDRIRAALAGLLAAAIAGCASSPPTGPNPDDFVWPRPPDPTRLTYVTSLSSEEELTERKESLKDRLLGETQRVAGPSLIKPYGVHADREGRVFVTDTALTKLVVFDLKQRTVSLWGTDGRGFLRMPIGVTSDSDGRVYVTDSMSKRLVIYDRDGNYLGSSGADANFERPAGVAVDEEHGHIYVADSALHHVVVLDMNGKLIKTIGEAGGEPGEFNFPTNLAVSADGSLNVVDSMNHRIQVFAPNGELIGSFGRNGDTSGSFSRPRGIGVDSDGNVYVADAAFNNFQIFNNDGDLLLHVGGAGRTPGKFQMPAGVYVDARNRLYVVDQFNRRVQVFQYHPE